MLKKQIYQPDRQKKSDFVTLNDNRICYILNKLKMSSALEQIYEVSKFLPTDTTPGHHNIMMLHRLSGEYIHVP